MTVQLDLCRTWSETPKTGFLTTRLISDGSSVCTVVATLAFVVLGGLKGSYKHFLNEHQIKKFYVLDLVRILKCILMVSSKSDVNKIELA